MISWIQTTFQHHFRTIFLVLLAAIVISFVFVIGASPGIGHGEHQAKGREFFGLNLASPNDARRLQGDASISVELQYGYPVFGGDQLQQFAFIRQACLHMADRLRVAPPSQTELTEAVRKLRMFSGQDGQFDAKRYNDFRNSLKTGSRITESDIVRVVGDNIRIERVQKLLAGPGVVLPGEVVYELQKTDTTWSLAVAKLDRASFQPTLNPSEAELTKFYEENNFRYTIPVRVIASYADFPAANYAAQVSANDADLRAFFDRNPGRFTPAAEPGKAPAATTDFNQVRTQVQAAYVQERAARLAAEAANRLSLDFFNNKIEPGSKQFQDAITAGKITVKELPAFTETTVPAELGRNPQVVEEAFRLAKDRTVSDAVTTDRGSAVLFYKGTIEATQPPFAEVRAQVLKDYTENERAKRFVAAGALVRGQIQAALKAGTSFEKAAEAAAAAQGIKVEVSTHPAFTLREPPKDLNTAVIGALDRLKAKEVSEMTVAENTGIIVYAADQKVPALNETNPNYNALRTQLAQSIGGGNASEYLQDVITRELEKSQGATATR